MTIRKTILLIISSVLISCGSSKEITEPLAVCTFNIAWLGDGINDKLPRTEEDYKRIAKILSDINADVYGLQEIENSDALSKVVRYTDGYSFVVAKTNGEQNVALMYKNDISVSNIKAYKPLDVKKGRTREGLVADCKKGNLDWTMMIVHLKSTSRFDSTEEMRVESREIRRKQADVLSKWVDSMDLGKEKDIMIVGDFNDFPNRKKEPTLTPLLENSKVEFITKERKSCKDDKWFSIDHIVLTKSFVKRFIPASDGAYNFYLSEKPEFIEKISDHCPVYSRFEILTSDND